MHGYGEVFKEIKPNVTFEKIATYHSLLASRWMLRVSQKIYPICIFACSYLCMHGFAFNFLLLFDTHVNCLNQEFHENCLIGCRFINILLAVPISCFRTKVFEINRSSSLNRLLKYCLFYNLHMIIFHHHNLECQEG